MTLVPRSQEPPFFSFLPVHIGVLRQLTAQARPPVKLITVTAPTGYGKTVLLSALIEHYQGAGADCRWLALDDRDQSIERVLTPLEVTLVTPGTQIDPLAALHQGDESAAERIDALLESLAAVSAPMVLVIDNLNYCTDETLHRLLDALIFRTPAAVHLILSSTEVLPFNQARAKLEGLLRPIGFAELSLDRAEIRELLGTPLCARLSEAAMDTIQAQTEGWPAAVRLMQIILSASTEPEQALLRFSGADEDLAALLNRQVLQDLDAPLRQFLLEVSLLRVFGVNLCRHATGDEGAAEHIQRLLKRNVFVIPLDRNRSWYRLHALFREFLLDEAQRQIEPARRRQILARAAEWCEHGGRWQDAIDYALESGSLPLAAAILERLAPMFVRDRGDLRQYIDWVERLQAAGAKPGWEAHFWYVWALVFHRRYEYARGQMDRLGVRVRDEATAEISEADRAAFSRRMEVISIAIDVYTDRLQDAKRNALRWLAEVSGDDPFNVATLATAAGIEQASAFSLVDARQSLRLAQSHITQAQSDYGLGWVTLAAAMITLHEGEYATGYQDLQAALTKARRMLGDHAAMVGTLSLLAAKCAVELGRDTEASELLAVGMRKIESHGLLDTAAFGLDAAVKLWNGEAGSPYAPPALKEIAAAYPPRLSLMLSCFLLRRLLRLGRVEEALAEAQQAGLGVGELRAVNLSVFTVTAYSRDLLIAAEIDLHVAAGRLKQAANLVAEQTRAARQQGRFARLAELALDDAAISLRSPNPAPTTRHLTRAVSIAARRGYLRPFRDRSELVAALVNETKSKDWGFTSDEERRFFAEVCRGLPMAETARHLTLDEQGKVLAEMPTARELELLSLVEAGLSNQQLADRLSVSVATVKWHLYNLYTKLGVSSRGAALARAKALKLLVH